MNGIARVFVGPNSDDYAHHGYRGEIRTDAIGVHFSPDDVDVILPTEGNPFPDWEPMNISGYPEDSVITIPWHRIDLIEWGADWTADETIKAEQEAVA